MNEEQPQQTLETKPPGLCKKMMQIIYSVELWIVSKTALLLFLVIFVNLFSGAFFGFNVGITGKNQVLFEY